MIRGAKKSILAILIAGLLFSVHVSADSMTTGMSKPDSINATNRSASYTVTDSAGNKYKITGSSVVNSSKAQTTTNFNTTHYAGGTTSAQTATDNRTKIVKADGDVAMRNGTNSASTSYNGTIYLTGASGSFTKKSDTLLYAVISVLGGHYFSCNGGSGSGTSEWSIY